MEKKSDLIFGLHPVLEAINAEKDISRIFIKIEAKNPLISEIRKLAQERQIQISNVPFEKLNRLVKGSHQGVVAELQVVETYSLVDLIENKLSSKDNINVLMLDRITDTRNFGAIVRSAECFGIDAVIIADRESSAINGFTIKSSAGAIFNVKICRENLKDALLFLKQSGFESFVISEKTNVNIREAKTSNKNVIILGSEEKGVSPFLMKNSDHQVKIDLKGSTQSFNVSVAAGIALFALIK